MRYYQVLILLCWVGLLSSLSLEYPSGNIYTLDFKDYAEAELQRVITKRSSAGGMESETWLGLSLKQLLEEAGETDWDLALIKSKDNFETTVNRVELRADSAYLALFRNGERLTDYDVRVIFPEGHESGWIRNLKSIGMEPLHSLPPLQIRSLEMLPLMVNPESSVARISVADLLIKGLRLTSADIVVITKDFRKMRYAYPTKQRTMYLEHGATGDYYLREVGQDQGMQPDDEILFLQCGNIGFIRSGDEERLPEIAVELGWDWLQLQKSLQSTKADIGNNAGKYIPKLNAELWLELK